MTGSVRTGPRPAPPGFSSYDPAECTWLLTDLSGVALEVPTEDREELIQGGRHYAEMLPVEYQPDEAYAALFARSLASSAARVAHAVGLVGDLVLAEARARGVEPVLVSLARAGTPVGILLRRWLARVHGVDAPHYAVSIVRGRGIDDEAVRWVLARHPAPAVRFVDGWTGKGAIARELAAAVAPYAGLDARLAVLADPGSCTDLFGTRDDFLVPSACLNSTVSGLVSRTVLRDDLIGPGMFHGAKPYPELAPVDVSHVFLDAVTDRFAEVAGQVAAEGRRTGPPTAPRPGRAGPRSRRSPPSSASPTCTWSSPGSARRPGCCCAGCPGRCSCAPTAPPTSSTSGCSPRPAACRSSSAPTCRTPASG